MTTAYGYIRVSTEHQAASGLGLAAQMQRVQGHMAMLASQHALSTGRVYRDKAVSASRIAFRRRPDGGKLFHRAKAGDHIVIAKLDRGFRSTKDCLHTLDTWRKRGVIVHILDIGVDTSSPSGQLMIGIMSTIAQWEAQRIGERIKDAFAARRKQNPDIAVSAVRVIGYAIDPQARMLTPHHEERAAGKLAADLRSEGQTCEAIASELNHRGYVRPANPFGPKSQRGKRWWTESSVRLLIKRHRAGWPKYPGEKESPCRS